MLTFLKYISGVYTGFGFAYGVFNVASKFQDSFGGVRDTAFSLFCFSGMVEEMGMRGGCGKSRIGAHTFETDFKQLFLYL